MLAVSDTEGMAVATSTLMPFRSLGTVMGVAVSSLVTQNGLAVFFGGEGYGAGEEGGD